MNINLVEEDFRKNLIKELRPNVPKTHTFIKNNILIIIGLVLIILFLVYRFCFCKNEKNNPAIILYQENKEQLREP